MNKALKITRIGNSAGVILPKALLEHLAVEAGEEISVVMTSRGIELSRREASFEEQMAAARKVMKKRTRALRELAK